MHGAAVGVKAGVDEHKGCGCEGDCNDAVEEEGELVAGDAIRVVVPHPDRVSIADYVDAMMQKLPSDRVEKILRNDALPDDRKQLLVRRIEARYDGSV